MTDREVRMLSDVLTDGVPDLPAPPNGLEAVAARVRRARRIRVGASSVATVAVVAGALSIVPGLRPDSRGRALPAAPAPIPAASPTPQPDPRFPAACPSAAVVQASLSRPAAVDPLPADFAPASVLMCAIDRRNVADGGEWSYLVEKRSTGDITAFVALLRQPSAPRTGKICAAFGRIIPWFAVIDASGRALQPAVPRDDCDRPGLPVLQALNALHWRTERETPVNQLVSPGAGAAGCPDGMKDVLAMHVRDPATGTRPAFPVRPTALRICVFDSSAGGTPSGTFRSGAELSTADVGKALNAFDKAPAATPCSARHSAFAMIGPPGDGAPSVYIELDGCHRLLTEDGQLRQLSPTFIAELTATRPS